MMHILRYFRIFFVVVLIGCTSIGVPLLPKDRAGFNDSMITSEEEQLLLNIVRMRFEDRPYFVSVDSITTSKTLAYGGGSNISASPNSGNATSKHQLTPFLFPKSYLMLSV